MSKLCWNVLVVNGLYKPIERIEACLDGESAVILYDNALLRYKGLIDDYPTFELVGGNLNKQLVHIAKSQISKLTKCTWR